MNKKRRNLLIAIGSILLVSVIAWQLFGVTTSAQPLTEADAKNLVKEMYSGEIKNITVNKNIYQVTLEIEKRTYEVMIDKNSGEVFGIFNNTPNDDIEANEEKVVELNDKQIKEKIFEHYQGKVTKMIRNEHNNEVSYEVILEDDKEEKILKVDAMTGHVDLLETKEINQQKNPPKKITEKEAVNIALEVVNGEVDDIDLEEKNGVTYYFIEIETKDDEATVQINAITGEVKSTKWDD